MLALLTRLRHHSEQAAADTLDRLVEHRGPGAKAVVWEHNTHIGDARATDMAAAGMVNVGQLVRERHAAQGVVLVRFGSHHGTVTASDHRLPAGEREVGQLRQHRPRRPVRRLPFIGTTGALTPLHAAAPDTAEEETWPTGM
ncbi:erythromycin esterase family protein [Streptomyces avidinii]|uniref:Erythromycin esterase-like protein n=1 Tax=Streptomyces avidinii TaxID=1895 RepID=A0ABS4KY41_STRAV|nr:erythromycin esterase family protein [Streptomyces avidinii]MBP2034952.1 erythromycin esterase-like protein [Streptomyces avidinii]GGY90044.1 hypothetical protein GCM10010343_14320 [Streptomyces avidinii]